MSHEHHQNHHHHHHSHGGQLTSLNGIFIISIVLNVLFVLVEAGIGWWKGSLSLLSDAGHNLSDVLSLLLVLIAFHLAKIHSNNRFTYGYKKSTVLISLVNAVILLVAVGAIVVESIHKLRNPQPLDGSAISWTAAVGIVVNGVTALLMMKGQKTDLNVRGAFLHMAADTLVSVGVVISGLVIYFTGWYVVDPIISLVIAAVILFTTWDLLTDSLRLSLDGMPEGITLAKVEEVMRENTAVRDVHHLHVWAISTTENALTAHVVIENIEQLEDVKHELKHRLKEVGVQHATIEIELVGSECEEHECDCHQ